MRVVIERSNRWKIELAYSSQRADRPIRCTEKPTLPPNSLPNLSGTNIPGRPESKDCSYNDSESANSFQQRREASGKLYHAKSIKKHLGRVLFHFSPYRSTKATDAKQPVIPPWPQEMEVPPPELDSAPRLELDTNQYPSPYGADSQAPYHMLSPRANGAEQSSFRQDSPAVSPTSLSGVSIVSPAQSIFAAPLHYSPLPGTSMGGETNASLYMNNIYSNVSVYRDSLPTSFESWPPGGGSSHHHMSTLRRPSGPQASPSYPPHTFTQFAWGSNNQDLADSTFSTAPRPSFATSPGEPLSEPTAPAGNACSFSPATTGSSSHLEYTPSYLHNTSPFPSPPVSGAAPSRSMPVTGTAPNPSFARGGNCNPGNPSSWGQNDYQSSGVVTYGSNGIPVFAPQHDHVAILPTRHYSGDDAPPTYPGITASYSRWERVASERIGGDERDEYNALPTNVNNDQVVHGPGESRPNPTKTRRGGLSIRPTCLNPFLRQPVSRQKPPVSCKMCHEKFTGDYRSGNLRRHVREKHPVEPKPEYTCRICRASFNRRDAQRKHEWQQHGLEDVKPKKRVRIKDLFKTSQEAHLP